MFAFQPRVNTEEYCDVDASWYRNVDVDSTMALDQLGFVCRHGKRATDKKEPSYHCTLYLSEGGSMLWYTMWRIEHVLLTI